MTTQRQPFLTSRLQGFGSSVFTEIMVLAQQHNALNLGPGFPNFDGPDFLKEALIRSLEGNHNQYCHTRGVNELNEAIARHQQRFYDLNYDPMSEITVTNGATEGVHSTLQALCEVGDEVVMFEPFYDSYRACIAMAGAVDRVVTLRDPDFALDVEQLERAISPKTRLILLNSPHNPTGKVFRRDELEQIAVLCRKHDLLVLSDEVYEHLVYDGEHVPIATLPGMRERTITLSSTGKTFSMTGWKIGYACAPEPITAAIRMAHQFVNYCNATPLQPALAEALDLGDDYYEKLGADYRERRDLLCAGLKEIGFGVHVPAGTFLMLADLRPLGYDDDVEFCKMLPREVGVTAVPPSAFYIDKRAGKHMVRFAFCKTLDVLEEGIRRLRKLKPAQ